MDVEKYHDLGYKGKGVKIAILDSGLSQEYLDQTIKSSLNEQNNKLEGNGTSTQNVMNIVQVIDFTKETKQTDSLRMQSTNTDDEQDEFAADWNGHGTFVAGIIGS